MRRIPLALGSLALVAASCTASAPSPQDGPGSGGSVTYDVQVDASTPEFTLATVAYFPKELKAHPGDVVRFTSVDRGEPHTVTFGTIIDDAIAALAAVPKDAPPGPPPPAVLKVPPALAGQLPNNVDLRQSAMQPCFLASGDPPARDACPKDQQKQPELTGTQTFYNSGFLPGRAVFSVKLATGAKPGIYNWLCLFHGSSMSGKLEVVDSSALAQTPDEVKARGTDQLNKMVQSLQPVVTQARAKAATTEIIAGAGDAAVQDGFVTDFFPKTASVPVGAGVTWRIIVGHTISFNAPSDAVDFVVKATDGIFHLNNKAIFAAGWPGQPLPPFPGLDPPPGEQPPAPVPAAPGASPPVPPPFRLDAGLWDGKGFRSSGIIFQFDPRQEVTYTVTFTQPGTYTYKCLIHLDMEGTLKVGQ